MFSAHNSWLRYFTELSSTSLIPADARSTDPLRGSLGGGEQELDFDAALQETLAEYGATRDRLEMLEKKLEKMLEIKEAKIKSEYEVAKRNMQLLDREGTVIRQIMAASPTKMMSDDDDITVKAERAGVESFGYNSKDQGKDLPTPNPEQRAQAAIEELEEAKVRLAHEERAREEAEHAREEAERAREDAERERHDAERARADAERALASIEARVKAAEGRARAVRAQVSAAGTNGNASASEAMAKADIGNSLMNMPNESRNTVTAGADGKGRFSPEPYTQMTGVGTMRGHAETAPAITMEEVHRRNPWIAAAAKSPDELRDPFVKPMDTTKKKTADAGSITGRKRKLSKRMKPGPVEGMIAA